MSLLSIVNGDSNAFFELEASFKRHVGSGLYVPVVVPGAGAAGASQTGAHILMPQKETYAEGVHALVEQCNAEGNDNHPKFILSDGGSVYRPLTFKEDVEARVNRYESISGDERLEFFNTWLDSCCAIVYKANSPKFKLVLQSPDLIGLPEDFSRSFKEVTYSQIQNSIELDRNSRGVKYRALLTKAKVLVHPAWLAALENDKALLKNYTDIVFAEKGASEAMGFWLLENTPQEDQLWALYISDISSNSDAVGNDDFNDFGRFLRCSP